VAYIGLYNETGDETGTPAVLHPAHRTRTGTPAVLHPANDWVQNLKKMSLNSLRFRRLVTDLSTVHSLISGNLLGWLSPYLNHIPPTNTHGHNLTIEMPALHYSRSSQNIISWVASICNTLPQSVLHPTSSASFRRNVSHYLKTHSLMDYF